MQMRTMGGEREAEVFLRGGGGDGAGARREREKRRRDGRKGPPADAAKGRPREIKRSP